MQFFQQAKQLYGFFSLSLYPQTESPRCKGWRSCIYIYGRRLHTLVRLGLSNSQLEKILTYDNKHRVTLLWICNLRVAAFIA